MMKGISVRVLCLVVVGVMCLSAGIPTLTNGSSVSKDEPLVAKASIAAETNDYEFLNLTFDEESDVTDYMWRAHYLLGEVEANSSVTWNETQECAELTSSRNWTGVIALGGFYPAMETTISFSVKLNSYGFNGPAFVIRWYGVYLALVSQESYVRCYEYYYNSNSVLQSSYANSPVWGIGALKWIDVQIDWHGNRTYHYDFSYNGTTILSGWSMTREDYDFTDPDLPWNSLAMLTFSPIATGVSYDTNYSCYLDNVTQTLEITTDSVYADYSHTKYSGMGFDGVYNETVVNTTELLESLGQRATYYFTLGQKDVAGGWTLSDMDRILSAGHEFGIHIGSVWGDGFSTYNESNIAELDSDWQTLSNYADDYAEWDDYTISWTSLGNGYDWPYNDYVFDTYDSIGRKFWMHWFSNAGGWVDEYNFSSGACERGLPYSGYNHKVGPDTDVPFSDWYDQLNTSMANGLNIVGNAEYWLRYSAPWYVSTTIDGPRFTIEYEDFVVKSEFEVTVNATALGHSGEYYEVYDLTDESMVFETDARTLYTIAFNATDNHQYAIPISADSDTTVTLNITRCSPIFSNIEWTATLDDNDESTIYYLVGLDEQMGYRVYQDGEVIATGLGPSFSFTAVGGGEFEIEVWHERTVSTLVVFTVNMVMLGIFVTIAASFVNPIAQDMRAGRQIKPERLMKNLVRTFIFIIVGLIMWGLLHQIAIG
jgi:hypothetical protein